MIDTKAVSKTIIRGLKYRIFGKSSYGNQDWMKADHQWYEKIHDSNYLLHENFMEYFSKIKPDIKTVLEVGCGTGIYPIREKEMFKDLEYTGIDFSSANIKYCKNHSEFNFLTGDFIKMNIDKKYDLVFSHAVIDHVYDIEIFLLNLVKSCKKFAYINSYIGYFQDLDQHKRRWRDDDHCYYNTISVKQIEKSLQEFGLSNNQFILRSQKANEKNMDNTQLVIEIDKTK